MSVRDNDSLMLSSNSSLNLKNMPVIVKLNQECSDLDDYTLQLEV